MNALIWTIATLLVLGLVFVLSAMLFYREPTPVPEDDIHGDVPRLDHEAKGEA